MDLMPEMVNFPFKSLAYFLQIRPLGTKTSILLKSTVKPVATVKVLKPKTQKKEELSLPGKEESVITLLKKHQFSDAQIALLAKRSPSTLRCRLESNLEPKLKFLDEIGFKGNLLSELLVKNPNILRRSLTNCLIPNIEYLRELMKNDQAAILFVVKQANWLLTTNIRMIIRPNIDLLLEEGVEMSCVLKLFASQPRTLLCSIDRMRYGVETVKKFGIKPTENMFIHSLRVALSMCESNLKKKVDIFKSLGWSDEDIAYTMARYPLCFGLSEDKIRSTFEFFVKTMHVKPEDVVNYPNLLMYSLNKRIIPRCKVIMALKEKELLKDFRIHILINMPEERFTRKFILNHPTLSSSLWILYQGNQKVDGIAV